MDRNRNRTFTASDHGSRRRDGHTMVILTAAACLLALVIALKNILDVSFEQLTVNLILCTCILGGLVTSYPLVTGRRSHPAISHPGLWIASIVIVTMAIIVMTAI